MKSIIVSILILIGLTASSAEIRAQRRGDGLGQKVREVRKEKIMQELALTEKQKPAFIKIYDSMIENDRKLHQTKKQLMKKLLLISEIGEDVSDDKIKSNIRELQAVEQQIISGRQKAVAELEKILTAQQLARFIVFEEHFQRRMQEMMFRMRGPKERPPWMDQFIGPGIEDPGGPDD